MEAASFVPLRLSMGILGFSSAKLTEVLSRPRYSIPEEFHPDSTERFTFVIVC